MATSTRGTTIATVLAMTAFAAAMACALLLVGRSAPALLPRGVVLGIRLARDAAGLVLMAAVVKGALQT